MDPDRVRAYLQISCAGLGFDIGELWWTSNKDGESTSALATIEEKNDSNGGNSENRGKKLRFVQLYTSKSYENRRPMLVRPTEEEENYNSQGNGLTSEDSSSDLEKHVLSPTLVDAISKTAQVVWAHTKKTEGLTGRSDIRLQTAVGMPVAVDRDGNMCVVVMFSPNNIHSTDNALEYLQSISRSATSTSIPCLLPAFDPKQGLISLQHHHHHSSINDTLPQLSNILTDDVVTRFVPLDENSTRNKQSLSIPEVHSDHDLESAPRDCFGIPMLPSVAELGNSRRTELQSDAINDAFDEASYGVWSTIMQNLDETDSTLLMEQQETRASINGIMPLCTTVKNQTYANDKPVMDIERQERLEEFASAFLDVSIFDLAEVWMPAGQNSDCLCLHLSVKSIDNNKALDEFSRESEKNIIKFWSGAVGRAYSSGNPVWSFKQDKFSDTGRLQLFRQAKIETVLAVPVFSGRSKTPSFIFSCYSFVRSGSIPFVLKFVQQALKLLWRGLDNVEPHESVDEDVWKHVAPADLGEMAADVEMHQHFMIKKRPIGAISTESDPRDESIKSLSFQVDSLETVSGAPLVPSIYTGKFEMENSTPQQIQRHTFEGIQSQLHDAIKSVADMKPEHHHVATNANGSKRAHVLFQETNRIYAPQQQQRQQLLHEGQHGTLESHAHGIMPTASTPLPLPQPFRLPDQVVHPVNNEYPVETQIRYQSLHQQTKSQPIHNPLQNQLSDYNINTSESCSFSAMQQHEPKKQEHAPVPTQVYSVSTNKLNAKRAIVSNHTTPFSAQITSILNERNPTRSIKTATQHTSSGRSTTNVSNAKSCRIQGCNDRALARRPYCVRHSGNRMCEHKGCSKCAQGSTRFCIAHGGGRRCTFPGCDKGARDKFFCAAHGGGKRCKFEGCNKSAVGGSNLCTAHGGGRRCAVDGCDKSAQSSTKFCVKHGGGKKCSFAGCGKVSRGRTQFCAAHGGGVRCKLAGCNRVAIGKVQLCRAHGGGANPKEDSLESFSGREVCIPISSSTDAALGSMQGSICVPIIEPVMDGYGRQQHQQNHQALGTDLANI